ncbi:hypothetical protein EON67_09500 [archaeon]|nr:MAG: hypothetical protein EON67_09500 [archaeon]
MMRRPHGVRARGHAVMVTVASSSPCISVMARAAERLLASPPRHRVVHASSRCRQPTRRATGRALA